MTRGRGRSRGRSAPVFSAGEVLDRRIVGVAMLLTTFLVVSWATVLAPPADARIKRNWTVRFFSAPDSNTVFAAINDDGHAVGTRSFRNGTRHGVFFDGRRLRDLGARLGAASGILDINHRDQMVGWQSPNPRSDPNNLFFGTDAATMPRAFFRSARGMRVLPFPSVATALNSNGLVVGVFLAGDGTVHGFVWNTAARAERAQVEGAPAGFIDRGQGTVEDVSDAQMGRFCPRAVCPQTRRVGGRRVRLQPRGASIVEDKSDEATISLTFDGGKTWRVFRRFPESSLAAINETGLAGGARFPSPGATDAWINRRHWYQHERNVTRLPEPDGFPHGVVRDVGNNGFKVGLLRSESSQMIGVWDRRNRRLDVNALLGRARLLGHVLVEADGVNTVGQIAGTAQTPQNTAAAFVLTPPVSSPKSAHDKLDNVQAAYAQLVGPEGVRRAFGDIHKALAHGDERRLCQALGELESFFYYLPRFAKSIAEIRSEIPCR